MSLSIETLEEIKAAAERLHASGIDWVAFYREVMGLDGIIRRACPTLDDLAVFEQTVCYLQIQRMLNDLRKRIPDPEQDSEPTKIVTLRIPQCLHEALHDEAHEHRTSMNKLCISKLVQFIDNDLVPSQLPVKRGVPVAEAKKT